MKDQSNVTPLAVTKSKTAEGLTSGSVEESPKSAFSSANIAEVLLAPVSRAFMATSAMVRRVYVGFGVAGRKGLSIAVPVDMLTLILLAEQARRAVLATGITFLIADVHAQRTGSYELAMVERAARWRRHIIFRACDALGIPDPKVFLASQIETDELYESLVKEATIIAKGDGEYFIRESADIEFFRRVDGVGLKVGWTLASSQKSVGRFDEQAFDQFYLETFPAGKQMMFLYASPGRTLDPAAAKAAPYLDFQNRVRILIERDEDVQGKLDCCDHEPTKNAALEYYAAIVKAWEELAGFKLQGITVVEKLNNLIYTLTTGMEVSNGN